MTPVSYIIWLYIYLPSSATITRPTNNNNNNNKQFWLYARTHIFDMNPNQQWLIVPLLDACVFISILAIFTSLYVIEWFKWIYNNHFDLYTIWWPIQVASRWSVCVCVVCVYVFWIVYWNCALIDLYIYIYIYIFASWCSWLIHLDRVDRVLHYNVPYQADKWGLNTLH